MGVSAGLQESGPVEGHLSIQRLTPWPSKAHICSFSSFIPWQILHLEPEWLIWKIGALIMAKSIKKKKRNHTYESLNCAHAVAESDLGTRLSLMYCKGEWIGTTWAHHRTQKSHIDGQRTVHWGRGDKSYFSKIVVPQKICTTVTKSTVIFNCCEIISAACVNEIAGPLSKWRGSRRQGELIARGEKQHSFRFKCHHVTLI